ncbi:MAG TPA: hypothetical protein VFR02_05680, partial [bacterium]|nr:hypothetical protein [bacterium]
AAKEAYGLISNLPEGGYVKLGKFLVPYGLGLSDDNSLVRLPLEAAFSFDGPTPDGVEVGLAPSPLFLSAALVNGASNPGSGSVAGYDEKAFSARGGLNFPEWTLGGSVYGENLDLDNGRLRYGTYGWVRMGPAVFLGELDAGWDALGTGLPLPPAGWTDYLATHASVEFDMGGSVYLRLTDEWLDDSRRLNPHDGLRNMVSLRCYPVGNLKLQVDLARMDPVLAVNDPDYSLVADAFVFY